MKRTLTIAAIVLAFAMLTVSARSTQQNGFFNAMTTFPTAPQQVQLKIDFATSSSSIDQFFMMVMMTRADVLSQSYYGVYSKADAIILRDTLNRVLPPLPPLPSADPTPQQFRSQAGAAVPLTPAPVASSITSPMIAAPGPAFTKPAIEPKRPKGVPRGAEYMGVSGNQNHWRWKDKKGNYVIDARQVNPQPDVTPKK